MLKAYGDLQSGNCYKVKLLLNQLELAHQWVHVDIMQKETRSAAFLSKNPSGKIPLLELDDGTFLSESNAILCYLAEGSPLWPDDRLLRAQVLQWLFFEQYSHEPYVAVARFIVRYMGRPASHEAKLQEKYEPGYAALQRLDQHLATRRFLVGDCYTIADIGLYAYSHVAHEGGFDLQRFPSLNAWLARVAQQSLYIGMDGRPVQRRPV